MNPNANYINHPITIPPLQPPWTTAEAHATGSAGEHDQDHDDHDDYDGDDVDYGRGNGDPDADGDKQIRRRSSKACDQCRKSKCKCERTGVATDPCRNCILLGQVKCTFLGPSRKRGPPKGYIDAIENRLHQVEALLGVFINSSDPRAVSLLSDVAVEPSAREIIERVTLSPYGSKASRKKRDQPSSGGGNGGGVATSDQSHSHSRGKAEVVHTQTRIPPFSKPIGVWQDDVGRRIVEAVNARNAASTSAGAFEQEERSGISMREVIRRRKNDYDPNPTPKRGAPPPRPANSPTGTGGVISLNAKASMASLRSNDTSMGPEEIDSSDSDEIASGVGQLSLNEHEQFRYHGKVSGLHLLGRHTRADKRNEGGVWRFPQAKIWSNPRAFGMRSQLMEPSEQSLQNNLTVKEELEKEVRKRLPDREVQEHLLSLYWTYVHPVLPVLDKEAVVEAWRNGMDDKVDNNLAFVGRPRTRQTEEITVSDSPPLHHDQTHSPSPAPTCGSRDCSSSRSRPPDTRSPHPTQEEITSQQSSVHHARVPLLLLLSMFSISARFSSRSPPHPPAPDKAWDAGDSVLADSYLADARILLNHTYSSSRPSTCQALLLLSYREIGVGAMAAAWLYVGMAVRMAQDLGMHRKSERWMWKDGPLGRGVFNARERQVRKKIWYTCVIMDKYVSTYIGRPLGIFERDFDTPLPDEEEAEEHDLWRDELSEPPSDGNSISLQEERAPVKSHALSCFNQAAKLSSILSEIVVSIYSVKLTHQTSSRHADYVALEEKLDKWLLELPGHLTLEKFQHQHQQALQELARQRQSVPGFADAMEISSGEISQDTSCKRCTAPAPHIFTLHMFYWCSVLLLHRPFIRARFGNVNSPLASDHDSAFAQGSHKPFELCLTAAGHITSIVSLYAEHYDLLRSPPFFTYYLFSAGIMYVTALSIQPDNPQAGLGLQKCMDSLQKMERTWPSAGRQYELLRGSKLDLREAELARLNNGEQRHKRAAEEPLEQARPTRASPRAGARPVRPFLHVNGSGEQVRRAPLSPPHSRPFLNLNTGLPRVPENPGSSGGDNLTSPFTARPYHLGLDLGAPSGATPPHHPQAGHNTMYPVSVFDRWMGPTDFGSQPQQEAADIFGGADMMDESATMQPRLPISSARGSPAPSNYWTEYGDSSMMSGSLYSLPLMTDPIVPGNINPTAPASFFTDADYPIFGGPQ